MTACHLARALDRVNAKLDFAITAADHRAGRQHRLVARAQHDRAREPRLLERLAHGLAGGLADSIRVTFAKPAGARQSCRLSGMDQLERKLVARLERRNTAPLLLHLARGSRSLPAAPPDAAPSGRSRSGGMQLAQSRGTTGAAG